MIIELLEPFEQSAKDLCTESQSVISQMYPIFRELKNHLNLCYRNKKYFVYKITIKAMHEKLNDYWLHNKEVAIICCSLDPRFKLEIFDDAD